MAKELNSTTLLSDANLQLYLRMEDNWNDTTANGYNFTASGSPTFVTGNFGNGGSFVAASSQYIYREAASLAKVIISTSQTWMFWIKMASFTDNNYIFGYSNGGNWFVNGGSGGSIAWSATGLSLGHGVTLPSTGVRHHVVFTYNSSTNKISSWLNGSIVQNDVSVTGSISGAGTNFAIGRIGDYPGYGTFQIDDFAFLDRAVTQSDINILFSSIKSVAGVANASIKKIGGVAIASVKKIGGVS